MRKIIVMTVIAVIALAALSGTAAAAANTGDPLSAVEGLISALEEVLATLESLALGE
ncbi:MAG: hypothetical protein J07HQX50_01158 [Haloquadratum sp. J07HQX50]|jgi:hypothetical protein|nr:MAG: hypothetical protein J07HQX50_01158 [Haloquadratum sp. J07HQX50]